ncbi:MAG: tyrosine-type recombinase/integrase, partial [Stellaceae bacterium]
MIRRELIGRLGEKQVGEIRRRDILDLLKEIKAKGVPEEGHRRARAGGKYAARHTLAALSKLYNWALSQDIDGLETNPVAAIKVADVLGSPKVRDRVLTETEIRLVWRAAEAAGYPYGTLIRALLMTGQRLNEIAAARWAEIDGAVLTVPAERMKGMDEKAKPHAVPLTAKMIDLLGTLPRFKGGEYLFSTTGGKRPISGFSKWKDKIDRDIAKLVAKDRAELLAAGASEEEAASRVRNVAPWTHHDLRRTARTGMAEAGVDVFFAELVVAHTQSGVHAT